MASKTMTTSAASAIESAATAGVLVGAAASIAALVYVTWYSSLNFYLYSVVGIGTCVLVGYLASLIFPRGGKELAGLTLYTQPPRE